MLYVLTGHYLSIFMEHMLFSLIESFFRIKRIYNVKKLSDCETTLEGHPINDNEQLLSFDVKSKSIIWGNLIAPLQIRNIRSARLLGRNFNYLTNNTGHINFNDRPEVLVCHDMMGNYLEDRFYESSKKWDFYKFYHWSGIDYFCYFSHKYITIPPCGWINAAHLHGVKVIGTFITEGNSGTQLLLDVLSSRERIDEICNALTKLCEHFCFEGWLINVECRVPTDKVAYLRYFVNNLRSIITTKISGGVVFWYDSIINNGELNWQNELNSRNMQYFNISNGTLINYNWNDLNLQHTKQILQQNNKKLSNAFFGIDVFGRGQIAKFQSGETLARITENKFSVGIFAPGWTFETLQNFNYNINSPGSDRVNDAFLRRNEKFWWLLWEYFATHPYVQQPFYTNFCLGSGKKRFVFGLQKNESFYNLCRQDLQPSIPLDGFVDRYFDDAVNGGSCLKIIKANETFRLFITDFIVEKTFIFAYAFKLNDSIGELDLILRISETDNQDCYLMCGSYNQPFILEKGRCYLSPISEKHLPNLDRAMFSGNIPIKLPFILSNNWNVRYYCVTFDKLIYVKDIGVLFKKRSNVSPDDAEAYLGAIYFNSVPNGIDLLRDGNVKISNQYVLND